MIELAGNRCLAHCAPLYDVQQPINRRAVWTSSARPGIGFVTRQLGPPPLDNPGRGGLFNSLPDTLEHLRTLLHPAYRVERILGSGGMATVYLAHDLKHDRPVAIKVLRQELSIELGRERFLREIRIAASLNHPHILPLHDSGEATFASDDGSGPRTLLYYVTPYITGETLRDRITREKQLSVDEAVRIAGEVASALAYAHGHGVIHRDIKPANILLSDGYALVADFGLARAITNARASSAITRGGLTMGTPAYMSPEQASGDATLDGRSDIYSLGCVLYEMLAGDPPFVASNPGGILARHAAAAVVPIRRLRPIVPAAVDGVVRRALEKVPADRFQDAGEMLAALAGERVPPRASERRSMLVRTGFAVASIAVAALAWLGWRTLQRSGHDTTVETARAAFGRGMEAVNAWDFDHADSALTEALVADTGYARAAVWQAAVRDWNGIPTGRWSAILDDAMLHPATLDARTAGVARALGAEADGLWPRACDEWRRLAAAGGDFALWYGLATCLGRDHAVIPDKGSPSGWRFRASAQEIVDAYRHAFERLRSAAAPASTPAFDNIRELFFVRGNQLRMGTTVPGDSTMLAAAEWRGDSLTFVPWPADLVMNGAPQTRPTTQHDAVIRQQRAVMQLAAAWLAADPNSPDALEAVANALQLEGDRAAIDSLRRAGRLARDPAARLRIATSELWFALTAALPDDSLGLQRIEALADSLLQRTDPTDAEQLQGIAALTGRATLAAELSGRVGLGADATALPAIAQDGPALLVYAALGGPADSVRRLEQSVTEAIAKAALAADRPRITEVWLGRAARIAYPDTRFDELQQLGKGRDGLLAAEAALDRGETGPLHEYLAMRARTDAETSPPEAVFAEARLLLAAGDTAAATAWLDRMFAAMPRLDPVMLSQVANAAAVVRAMALRADLAARAHDAVLAARWARPVVTLWQRCDRFLEPTVRRMAQLAGMSGRPPRSS